MKRNNKGQFVAGYRSDKNTRVNISCPVCSKIFEVKAFRLKTGRKICCSRFCGNYAKRGVPTKKRGTTVSKEVREKISFTLISKGNVGEKASGWKGGKTRHKDGYIHVLSRDHPFADRHGYVFEHRLVMEKKLGRFLCKEEHVHHINGIKDDNREDNLMVMSNSEHLKLEWKNSNDNNFKNCINTQFKKGLEPWNKKDSKKAEIRKARISAEGQRWTKQVKKRDDCTCVLCGAKEKIMYADHILPFAYFKEFRFDINNGRTLCRKCHLNTSTFGTFSKEKRQFYETFCDC